MSKIIKITTTPQLIANNMSGCFFLKHGVHMSSHTLWTFQQCTVPLNADAMPGPLLTT